jgi:DNA-binding response OmpR family regulator
MQRVTLSASASVQVPQDELTLTLSTQREGSSAPEVQNQLKTALDAALTLARGRDFEPFDRSLDVQVSRLRKLIELDATVPRYIQTVWGVGYVFVPDGN